MSLSARPRGAIAVAFLISGAVAIVRFPLGSPFIAMGVGTLLCGVSLGLAALFARQGWRKSSTAANWAGAGLLMASVALSAFDHMATEISENFKEGVTKGNLGALRSALSIYYGDYGGRYPTELNRLLDPKLKAIDRIPTAGPHPHHPYSSAVRYGAVADDSGGWLYNNASGDRDFGKIWVNCTHTDRKGTSWTAY